MGSRLHLGGFINSLRVRPRDLVASPSSVTTVSTCKQRIKKRLIAQHDQARSPAISGFPTIPRPTTLARCVHTAYALHPPALFHAARRARPSCLLRHVLVLTRMIMEPLPRHATRQPRVSAFGPNWQDPSRRADDLPAFLCTAYGIRKPPAFR